MPTNDQLSFVRNNQHHGSDECREKYVTIYGSDDGFDRCWQELDKERIRELKYQKKNDATALVVSGLMAIGSIGIIIFSEMTGESVPRSLYKWLLIAVVAFIYFVFRHVYLTKSIKKGVRPDNE